LFVALHETIASVEESSTISYVLLKNGGGAFEFCIGVGAGNWDEPSPPPVTPLVPSMLENFDF
jgi:hypothetical protein